MAAAMALTCSSSAKSRSEACCSGCPDSTALAAPFAAEFYAPWCGHCKRLTPEWKALAAAVAKDPQLSSRVVIAKVNADKHSQLGSKFNVQGFPTIKFFGKGMAKPMDYEGGRTADEFLSFLREKARAGREDWEWLGVGIGHESVLAGGR